ncbi:hypothetical protein H7J84_15170, partial [Mycobacterium goodii]
PTDGQAPAAQPPADQDGRPAQAPPPAAAVPPSGPVQLSGPKAAALQEVQSALTAAQEAQRSGDFAEYGEALQRLDDAMKKFDSTR